jgi:HPt (histidine-containing phosphotransfer) domain-containing protein
MDNYLAKPIRAEQLFDTLASTLGVAPPGDEKPKPAAEHNGNASLDWSEALAAVNNDHELLKDVVEAFLEEAPKLLSEIRHSIDAGDAIVLRRAAHTLKGSVRIFAAHQANELAYRLETMGREQSFDHADETYGGLVAEMERLFPHLFEYVGRGPVPKV